ncbi:MAG: phosphoribosylpyrophosphate synthetase, partial [Desulfuromonadaceae bacterium]|nr:phosphoribosylpyrophosphate synthetase [Desulfuromonadaceae bacterium]
VVTNTIPAQEKITRDNKLTSLSVSGLLSEAIRRIHNDESVSSLFV